MDGMASPPPAGWMLLGALAFAVFLLCLVALTAGILRLCLAPPGYPELKDRLQRRALEPGTLVRLVAILAGLNGLLVAGARLAFRGDPAAYEASQGWILAAQTLTFHGAGLALVCWAAGRNGERIGFRLGWNHRWVRAIGAGLWSYLALLPLVLGAGIAWRAALQAWGHEMAPQSFLEVMAGNPHAGLKVYLVFAGIALAPVAEELLFRGVLLPFLSPRIGLTASVLSTALLFAALHFNAAAFLPIFLLGLGLGALYALTGHILAPVTLHALFNGVNLALLMHLPPGASS